MIYGFMTITSVTTISETSWSFVGRLSMPSGESTTSLASGTTVFIKGTNTSGNSTYKKFIVDRTTYARGKLTIYVNYNDVYIDENDIYAPSLENPYGVITTRGTDEGFYFLPTTELNSEIPQSDLDYIRNLDLQERDVNYDRKMQEINSAQDVFMNENKTKITQNADAIMDLQNEDVNIYNLLRMISDGGTFDDDSDAQSEGESE